MFPISFPSGRHFVLSRKKLYLENGFQLIIIIFYKRFLPLLLLNKKLPHKNVDTFQNNRHIDFSILYILVS